MVDVAQGAKAQQQSRQHRPSDFAADALFGRRFPGLGEFFATGPVASAGHHRTHHRVAGQVQVVSRRQQIANFQRLGGGRGQGEIGVGQGLVGLCIGRRRRLRLLRLQHPLQQVLAKGREFFLVIAATVDQQNQVDVAGWKAIDQTRQQLQFKVLDALRVGEDHVALGDGLVGFVQRLVQGHLRQDVVEAIDQFVRVGRGPQLDMLLALLAQVLKNAPTVMRQGHLVFAQDGQVQSPLAQRLEQDFKAQFVRRALVEVTHGIPSSRHCWKRKPFSS